MSEAQKTTEVKPAEAKKPWQQTLRDMAESDPRSALELSMQETERARVAMARSRDVTYDEKGLPVYRTHEALMQLGRFYSTSDFVPDRFSTERGKPNADRTQRDRAGDCAIAITMARRWNLDPLFVMQGLFIVHGTPGVTGALATTVLINSGVIKGRPWTVPITGDNGELLGYEAHAIDRDSGREYVQTCTFKLAKDEGWYRNSKWETDPVGMCQHRARSRLVRHDFPDVLGAGVYLVDELEDTFKVDVQSTTPIGQAVADDGMQILKAATVAPPTEIKRPVREKSPDLPRQEVAEVKLTPDKPGAEVAVTSAPAQEAFAVVDQRRKEATQRADAQGAIADPPQDEPVHEEVADQQPEPAPAAKRPAPGLFEAEAERDLDAESPVPRYLEKLRTGKTAELADRIVAKATTDMRAGRISESELASLKEACAKRKQEILSQKA